MRIAFRVDAGPVIGGGHAMRCLTLADALAERGAECTFVTAAMPEALRHRIEESGHKLTRIPASPGLDRQGGNWHEPPLHDAEQDADARATRTAAGTVEWLIVDHYLLDARWHSAARNLAERLLVIDDLANRPYDCDLIVDQTFGCTAGDYAVWVPSGATVLAGANYALLRPQFEQERRSAIDRRKDFAGIKRVLISLGTADMEGRTEKIASDVLAAAPDCALDVVPGLQADSMQHVRELAERNSRIKIHVDTREMAKLMRNADLAIGAAGTTSWERCCLGLPSIALILAENQRPSAVALAEAGAAVTVESVAEVVPVLTRLLAEPDQLRQMSAAAFAITDGRGTGRVVSAMLGENAIRPGDVVLRPARDEDAELLWLWRNDPETRRQSRDTAPISWDTHVRWLTVALADRNRQMMMAERSGLPVGTIGFHPLDGGGSEVSITVSPEQRGAGIARTMLKAACAQRREDIYAAVRIDNDASRHLFEACGFSAVESTEAGFVRYLRAGQDRRRRQA